MCDKIMNYLFDGNLHKLKKIFDKYDVDLHKGDEHIFRWSCRSNNTEVPKWLFQHSIDINSPINIFAKYKNNDAFRVACCYGNLETAIWLWNLSCELNSPYDIHMGDDCAFRISCNNDHYETAKWLWELSQKINSPINVRVHNDYAFKQSCLHKNLDLVNWLCEVCPDYQINITPSGEIEYTIKTIFDKIKENRNNTKILQKLIQNFAQLEEYKISIESEQNDNPVCLICMQDNNVLFNLKCFNKNNHHYCIDCFCLWYSKHVHKCTHCTYVFQIKNKVENMGQVQRLPIRRERE
jgi:hypothetical protein